MQYYFAFLKNNAVSYWRQFAKDINNNQQINSNMVTSHSVCAQRFLMLKLYFANMYISVFLDVTQHIWCKTFTQKMEVPGSTKTFVPIYQMTQCHIPEEHNLNIHHCKKLKSHVKFSWILFCRHIEGNAATNLSLKELSIRTLYLLLPSSILLLPHDRYFLWLF